MCTSDVLSKCQYLYPCSVNLYLLFIKIYLLRGYTRLSKLLISLLKKGVKYVLSHQAKYKLVLVSSIGFW